MTIQLNEIFSLYRFPNGRRAYALEGVKVAAEELNQPEIAAAAQSAFAWEKDTTSMHRQWTLDKKTKEGVREEAVELDKKIDRAVSGLATQLQALSSAFEGGDLGKLAQRTLDRLIPGGVAGIVLLNYEEQLAKCRELVASFRALPADDLAQLNVEPMLSLIESLIPQFKKALDGASTRELSYADIKAREAQGQELMLSVLAQCIAAYPNPTDEDRAQRDRLIAPILDQQRRLKESFARRTGQTDIDPDTGEELLPSSPAAATAAE